MDTPPKSCHRRPLGDRVNSNVYNASASPSLADEDLLELVIANDHDLDLVVEWFKGRRSGLNSQWTTHVPYKSIDLPGRSEQKPI